MSLQGGWERDRSTNTQCDASGDRPTSISLSHSQSGLSSSQIMAKKETSREHNSRKSATTKKISPSISGTTDPTKGREKSHVDESHAVIVNGTALGGDSQEAPSSLSSDEDDDADVEDEESVSGSEQAAEGAEDEETRPAAKTQALTNGVHKPMSEDADVDMDEDIVDGEPSFGHLLAAKSKNPISIAEAFPSTAANALVPAESSKPVSIPSGVSLSTVLTQALRTNDNNLLESCFHNTDTQTIRSTIQRIDSSLAGILIQKLAERLSSRPGRYGHLLVWVQWICVAHGGAIGGRPDVLSKVKTLYNVLNQRSKALDSLLLLKGKLDMLDAQLGLRKQLLADRGPTRNPDDGHVIYIEGEEDDESTDEDVAMDGVNTTSASSSKNKGTKNLHELVPYDAEDSEDDEDMSLANGISAESDASDYDSEGDDEAPTQQQEGGLVDDEAEESGGDSHPSDRDDDESEEEGSDDDEQDSEMDDFIDDGPIEEAESASEISIDKTPQKPSGKKKRRS